MTNYPNLNNEPELLKIKTRDYEIKNLKNQTEEHDFENILRSLKKDNEKYKKKYKTLKKNFINRHQNISRIWIGNRHFNNFIIKSKYRSSFN